MENRRKYKIAIVIFIASFLLTSYLIRNWKEIKEMIF